VMRSQRDVDQRSIQAASAVERCRHIEADVAIEPAVALAPDADGVARRRREVVAGLVHEIGQYRLILPMVLSRRAGRSDAAAGTRTRSPGFDDVAIHRLPGLRRRMTGREADERRVGVRPIREARWILAEKRKHARMRPVCYLAARPTQPHAAASIDGGGDWLE